MWSPSRTSTRIFICLLAILLLPGWVELAGVAVGAVVDRGAAQVLSSVEDRCSGDEGSLAAHSEEEGDCAGCAPICDHCWCCGSLPALPSAPELVSEALWIASSTKLEGPSPQAPPLRAIPPPVRPPILLSA